MKNITLFGIIFLSLVFARIDCLGNENARSMSCDGRVIKDSQYYTSDSLFCIHYNTQSGDLDTTDLNNNNIPDYIEEVGIMADSARNVLVYKLQYDDVPADTDGIYDIYLKDYGKGTFGHCCKDFPSQNIYGQTSYLQIDTDYNNNLPSDFVNSGLEFMRITLVHEYFHAIQYGYRGSGIDPYFYEMTSMWIEDVIVPDGDDYLDWPIWNLINNPEKDFGTLGPGYELALFGHYLSSYLDPNGKLNVLNSTIMREIWTRYGSNSGTALSAIKDVLNGENYPLFIECWVDFISRNLYNGIYDDMDNPHYYYIDQTLIDPIKTTSTMLTDSALIELDLDNKSVAIESFLIDSLESLITVEHGIENFIGRVAIISTDNYEYNNLFWGSDTTVEESFNNAEVHFVYGIDGSSTTLPIEITAHTVPLPPLSLMVVAAQDSIVLSWNPSPGPGENLSYVVFRDNDSIYVLNDTNYVDKNIEGGQSYTYKVTCQNTVGESSASNTISIMSWPDEENVISSTIMNIYPNPIRQSQELTILYALDSDYPKPIVNLINVRGEVVNSIKLSSFSQGWHRENINSILNTNPSNGVYFIRLQPDQESRHTKKITILN
ncbi:MAG: T9SS type A sorting domain-containing protein [Candidatus Marinimicrobia bacterium]|nr:T9SS type A sorting domain-containing protein [Candidatus Neomarinimicrobiota bacterium]